MLRSLLNPVLEKVTADKVTADSLTNGDQSFSDNSSMVHDRADAVGGREVNVKRDGAYDVTVDTEGSETIDGADSVDLQDKGSVTLVCNNAENDWEIW